MDVTQGGDRGAAAAVEHARDEVALRAKKLFQVILNFVKII